ncbi:MAG: hypothetical protein K2G63_07600, partial [Oscillospiraceae bacterium]|nr:hypothetical protein [Oscillospiraceae bacterium]
KTINKKITGKLICLACSVGIIGTTIFLSGKNNDNNNLISVSRLYESDKPIIILDAGHGESA